MTSNRLRVLRAERRTSQLRTALAAGIHPTHLWKIENDVVTPTAEERAAIACVLEVEEREVWPGLPASVLTDHPFVAGGDGPTKAVA